MTERFQKIEDETFPSFLVESLISDNSEILENVSISSNLGIPVAASTVAKGRTIGDARQDTCQLRGLQVEGSVHATYLEETKLAQGDFSSQDDTLGILALERMQDLSIGLCTLSLKEEKENQYGNKLSENDPFEDPDFAFGDHFNTSLSSFLENEKLLSASLDASFTDDDLDDEQLETYFKQLVPPTMQHEDIEDEELPEAEFLLSSHGSNQVFLFGLEEFKSSECSDDFKINKNEKDIIDISAGKNGPGLADAYLSPSHTCRNEIQDTSDKCQSIPEQKDCSMEQDENDKGISEPHSVVYQNEDGKWVTDLAYYTSFNKEPELDVAGAINDDEFVSGLDAVEMIKEDEKQFEREHRFIQEEKMDLQNTSLAQGDASWKIPANSLLRTSQLNSDDEDASYLRLSLGEFFGQRSEALGCLGGDLDVKRPSFGYRITSPDKQEPIVLLRSLNSSRSCSDHDTIHFDDILFPEDLGVLKEEQTGSVKFDIGKQDDPSKVEINMQETDNSEKEKEHFDVRKPVEMEQTQGTESMLSISTIASALANASVSADPSQLAAMIMALSNKNRKKTLDFSHEMDTILMNQIFSSSLEKSQALKSFDMERYLKKTDCDNQEVEHQSFTINGDSIQDFTYDLSSLQKQTLQHPITIGVLNSTYFKIPDDSVLLDSKSQICKNIPGLQVVSSIEEGKISNGTEYSKIISDDQAIENTLCSIATNVLTLKEKELDGKSNGRAISMKECFSDLGTNNKIHRRSSDTKYEECVKDASEIQSSSLKQLNKNRSSWENSKSKFSCASEKMEHLPLGKENSSNSLYDTGSENSSFVQSIPASVDNMCTRKSSTISLISGPNSKMLPESCKRKDENFENSEKHKYEAISSNAKHVSFEKQSCSLFLPENVALPECKFPEHVNCPEDEQCSFRPSTSPLIHSSPSQVIEMATALGVFGDCVSAPSSFQTSACGDTLPFQSSHSSPGISRLTYISSTDGTLHDNTIVPSPQKEGNKTIELSTTIVRASPTPSEDHTSVHSGETNLVWQTSQDNSSRKLSQRASESRSPTENDGCFLQKLNEELSSNQPDSTFKEKMDTVNCILPSKSSFSHQASSENVDAQLPWQEVIDKDPNSGLSPLNMLSSNSGLDICAPLTEHIPVDHYIPIPSFKSFNAISDLQTVSSVPTLLTGCSLSATPFAQQYLATIPSGGTVTLPQYQISNSGGYSLPPGLPSSVQGRHIQNSVTVGIPVGSSVQSGLLGPSAVRNTHSYSGNQNVLPTEKSYTGLRHWGTRMTSGFGNILVPEEFKFPNACCVGIASQTSFSMYNPTERWLQVSIGILSVAVNGEKMDTLTYPSLIFKNKTIIGPHAAEETQILFLPHRSGIFQFVLTVSSCPVSADAETIVRSEALAVRIVLTAVAENPLIEVDTGKTDGLDFGDLTSGSWKALPLKLTNNTYATVPIRLIISANAAAWHCFMFSKEPVEIPAEHLLKADRISHLAAPSVINHVMHARCDGQDPEVLIIWVLFRGPQRDLSATDSLGPAEDILARIDVEVDSPGPANVIKSVLLRARTGIARIHAPKDLQIIHLCAKVGFSAKQLLPLKNAGNIAVQLKLQPSDQSNCFVVPEDLFLVPGEEQEVEISFLPQDSKSYKESVLKIFVQPSGPQYEVILKGEVEMPGNIKSLGPPSSLSTEVPPILSNKQFIAWGGVALGRAVQQKLVLRNDSPSATQSLRLVIRGQDQDCFQLQSAFGPEERLTNNRELVIRPKEDVKIFLMFTPTRVACMMAKLEIKQLALRSSQPGIKFTIPLSGYGGTSNIILENVKKLLDNYVITLNGISSDEESKFQFSVRNTGSRAAFVKSVCYTDAQTSAVMDPNIFSISPEKFVLKERTQEVVTVTCHSTRREHTLCTPKPALFATVALFCGDEISRKQYRRALFYKPEASRKILSQNSLLRNIKFDEEFQGEQLVTEVYDLPQRSNDIQLFYGNLHKAILSVFGSIDGSNGESCLPSSRFNLEFHSSGNTERHISNMSLDVLPVKGPQGPPLCLNIVDSACKIEQTWTIHPEHLILTAPSISGKTTTRHIKLSNITNRILTFELSWPAHCLTITPQHGIIEPQHHILILVSPNPSLVTKSSVLPWSGHIYIHCDNGQKFVKVQIQEDIAMDIPTSRPLSKQLVKLSPRSGGKPIIHVAKPLIKLPSTKIEIKNRTLVFPNAESSESSETYLDIENLGSDDVKWHLSAFAPPYVKGVDESEDVYRATYTVFQCSQVCGMLEAYGKEQVAFSFFPRERGDYAQFWDMECHPSAEPHLKHKLRFQLCGTGTREINGPGRISTESLLKTEVLAKPNRRSDSEFSTLKLGQYDIVDRGVHAPEDVCSFPPTKIGECSMMKVNLQNSSFSTHMLKFVSPREPFYIKHSKYSLRPHHYINLPVKFKPNSEGRFEGLLVVQTDTYGDFGIRLIGEALTS
uniref:Centrosomal protein of 192 kDa isoform X2 n=1 Tax=Geotrypetes seraphini TaxID=260995 RepID=A0A6P8Q4I5_GEOSA|nr:centrosomal protein of 192 kDa isoform X2 [Geotrypetes seraphini]